MNVFLLEILPLVAVIFAISLLTALNPILAVLFLIAVFITVSAYLALLGLTFLALSYLIIYVGAIAILFLFVVMMLDIKLAELSSSGEEASKVYPVAFLIGTPFLWTLTGSPLFRVDILYNGEPVRDQRNGVPIRNATGYTLLASSPEELNSASLISSIITTKRKSMAIAPTYMMR